MEIWSESTNVASSLEKNIYPLSERLASLGIMGINEGPSLNPSIRQCCDSLEFSRSPSSGSPNAKRRQYLGQVFRVSCDETDPTEIIINNNKVYSRHVRTIQYNGGTSGAPLKPLRVDSALRQQFTDEIQEQNS